LHLQNYDGQNCARHLQNYDGQNCARHLKNYDGQNFNGQVMHKFVLVGYDKIECTVSTQ
jgi:hypothetical protein